MRVLCVCDEGNSRSPTLASMLRYGKGGVRRDTLAVGVKTAEPETLRMLVQWADRIIVTDEKQLELLPPPKRPSAVEVWPIDDIYPRPFNPELVPLLRRLIQEKGLA